MQTDLASLITGIDPSKIASLIHLVKSGFSPEIKDGVISAAIAEQMCKAADITIEALMIQLLPLARKHAYVPVSDILPAPSASATAVLFTSGATVSSKASPSASSRMPSSPRSQTHGSMAREHGHHSRYHRRALRPAHHCYLFNSFLGRLQQPLNRDRGADIVPHR